MKILIDMNLSPFWVNFFSENNVESIHWSSVGRATDPDKIIFDYAALNQYVVFTNDLDFGIILATLNTSAPSVFQIRGQNLMPKHIGKSVLICLQKYSLYLESGSLITFDERKERIRILPLKGN